MQTLMIAVQLALPASLVLWIAFFPGSSWFGFCPQLLGAGVAFFPLSTMNAHRPAQGISAP